VYKPPHLTLFATYVCRVHSPIDWDRSEIERELGFEIPEELATLWRDAVEWSSTRKPPIDREASSYFRPGKLSKNRRYRMDRNEVMRYGDLVFAGFRGDLRLALIRGDKDNDDYGTIMIVAEIDERSDWYAPARSVEEFLVKYMDTHGDDYWDVHYDRIL